MASAVNMTGTVTPIAASKTAKLQLITLLKSCIQHLETSDEYAPIIYQTSNKLHEYADKQSKRLEAQILKLHQEREQAMKQAKAMQQQQQRQLQQQNAAAASKAQAAAEANKVASQKLSALEERKRAAAEKRRQQVIEQRRKAALEQKKQEEERKRKFLEKERRKEELKAQAARKAAENKAAAQLKQEQKIEKEAMSELDKIAGLTSTEPEVPIAHANLERTTTPTDTASNQAGPAHESPATPLEAASTTSSQPSSPMLNYQPVAPVAGQSHQAHPPQTPLHAAATSQPPPPTSPSLDDAVGSSSSIPDAPASVETMEDPPSLDTSEVKKQILIQWGLQPPSYQILKRVDQLVVSIQTVFPPFGGVPAHTYFDGWQVLSPNDFLCYGEDSLLPTLDTDKLKKAVRKIRFFLHPDKLPRDMTEGQIYVCKLLWDVTNDALEEFKNSQA